MTTEDDFQAQLDKDPTDWQTRLVFADWLEERNDPRAEGYQVLGLLRKYPHKSGREGAGICWWTNFGTPVYNLLPKKWFRCLKIPYKGAGFAPCCQLMPKSLQEYPRRKAEDAAALAYGKLSRKAKAEIMAEFVVT